MTASRDFSRGRSPKWVRGGNSRIVRKASFVLDGIAVFVFVLIGRAVHTGGVTASGLASTIWPFATGVVVGSLVRVLLRSPSSTVVGGMVVWIATVGIGMALRVASGQGTDFAFVVVALGFLGATMLGWRVVLVMVRRLRPVVQARRMSKSSERPALTAPMGREGAAGEGTSGPGPSTSGTTG
ncbi:MAG TPA: DUF3054 domain-containing protein [Acidimicrobiales bacterium]|nr:DUF3054 domain-containing protein [Acidimicrobiales bacterium]